MTVYKRVDNFLCHRCDAVRVSLKSPNFVSCHCGNFILDGVYNGALEDMEILPLFIKTLSKKKAK